MNWGLIRSTLVDVVAAESGLPTHWVRKASAWRADAHARLDLLGVRSIGVDEERLTYDEVNDVIEQRRFGQRVIRVQIAFETQSQDLSKTAIVYAEKVRSRLRLEEVHAALNAAGLAFSFADEVMVYDYDDEEGRTVSFAGFEARFNAFIIERGKDLARVVEVAVGNEDTGEDVVVRSS